MNVEPFPITIDGRKFLTFPHDEDRAEHLAEHPELDPRDVAIIMVSIFRNKGYMDMVEVVEIDDVEDEYQTHVILGELTLVDWLVGFAFEEENHWELRCNFKPTRITDLEDTEKTAGKFDERFGWRPTVTINDNPAEYQENIYFKWSLQDLEATDGVPREFINNDHEDDGA